MNKKDGIISFIIEAASTLCFNEQNNNGLEVNSINLLNQSLNILHYIPKLFKITTNNGFGLFNTELLKDTSPIIAKFLDKNIQLEYHLDINDEKNIISKLESLYQGKSVLFNKDDYPTLKKIFSQLHITKFPINQLLNDDQIILIDLDPQPINIANTNFIISKMNLDQFLVSVRKSFIISTNNKKYICNVFGVVSSAVIRDFLYKNPDSYIFNYVFPDEKFEFQYICDVFNFKPVKITLENVDIIKNIAEELQIDAILDDVNHFYDECDKINQRLDEQQKIIDSIDELFEWLYHIKTLSVLKVKELIVNSVWVKTDEDVQELVAFIIQVLNADFQLHSYLIDLLIELDKEGNNNSNKLKILIPFITEKLMNSFEHSICNCSFIYNLYKRGIIKKEDIMEKLSILINLSSKWFNGFENVVLWFLPEIIELHKGFDKSYIHFYLLSVSCQNFIDSFLPDKFHLYDEIRNKGEPISEITKAIRYDNVDLFQQLVAHNLDKISTYFIPFNLYENYISNGGTNYINYAAAYGSIKCFKYLLLNNCKIDEFTFNYAIYGGNIEIIRIVDQNQQEFEDVNDCNNDAKIDNSNDRLYLTIIKHQNDLFDWILEQKYLTVNEKFNVFAYISAINGNIHALIGLIDKGYDYRNNPEFCFLLLQAASRKGFYRMSKLLFHLMQINPIFFEKAKNYINQSKLVIDLQFDYYKKNLFEELDLKKYPFYQIEYNKDPSKSLNNFYFESAVYYGNLAIFKLYEKFMKQDDFEKVINFALEKNYFNIFVYFFESIINTNVFKINQTFVSMLLNSSVKRKSGDLFNYLREKFIEIDSNFFEKYYISFEILETACIHKNTEAAKEIIDLIDETPNDFESIDEICIKFTSAFIQAIKSGAIEICKYFFEKKIEINLRKLFEYSFEQELINLQIFHLLNDNLKSRNINEFFGKFILAAIAQKDKEILEFILENNAPIDDYSLIKAVDTNDIEIVNIILKYNSKPYFVNYLHLGVETALNNAVENNNLEIIKRILSIQEINVNISDSNNLTPLKKAFLNNNDKIIEIFLESFHNVDTNIMFDNGTSLLMKEIEAEKFKLIEMLINHPQTDINHRDFNGKTALILASYHNLEYIVDLLINNAKFDPEESLLNYAFFNSSEKISQRLITSNSLDVNYFNSRMNDIKKYETTLTNAVKLFQSKKVDLIISHHSFNKDKSQLSTALNISISQGNIQMFRKLLKLTNCHDDVSKSLSLVFSSNIEEKEQIIKEIFDHNKNSGNFFDFSKLLPNRKSLFTSITPELTNIQEIVNLFLENGADPNIPDKFGIYPLQHAIDINSEEFVDALINSKKIDFNQMIKIKKIKSPENKLMQQFVNDLIVFDDIKIDFVPTPEINQQNDAKFKTYLHLVARSENNEMFAKVLKFSDINMTDDVGETPLMEACRYLKIKNIDCLFEMNDLNFLHCNNKGEDALKIVSKMFNIENPKESTDKNEYLSILKSIINREASK